MGFIYTQHAEGKLLRADIRKFGISKDILEKTVLTPDYKKNETPTGEQASISDLANYYIIRVVYDKLASDTKIITFYISKKGRYNTQ